MFGFFKKFFATESGQLLKARILHASIHEVIIPTIQDLAEQRGLKTPVVPAPENKEERGSNESNDSRVSE